MYGRGGQLRSIQRRSQPTVEVHYDPKNPTRVIRVSTRLDKPKFIDFEYNSSGHVKIAEYEDGTRYEYKYNDGLLVNVLVDGRTQVTYGYDVDGHLNHIRHDEDPEPLLIGYRNDRRTELSRGTERIRWEFHDHPSRPRVITTTWSADSEPYQIEYMFNEADDSLTMKHAKWKEPKIYHLTACGCKPLDVTQSRMITDYTYDHLGQIKEIKMPSGATIQVDYHQEFFKITYLEKTSKNLTEWYKFEYNDQSQLFQARNHKNRIATIEYDELGLVKMVRGNWDDKVYYFSYNESGKPKRIRVPGLGVVSIDYDYRGKVKSVNAEPAGESKRSSIKSQEILSPLQQVMKVIEPSYKLPIDRDFTQIEATL